jgi:hypothetical protein
MKFEIEMRGFDELRRKYEDLQRQAAGLQGRHKAPLDKLFPPQFMRRYTMRGSFQAMLAESRWKVATPEDFAAIPDDEWDAFVRQETDSVLGRRCKKRLRASGRAGNSASSRVRSGGGRNSVCCDSRRGLGVPDGSMCRRRD